MKSTLLASVRTRVPIQLSGDRDLTPLGTLRVIVGSTILPVALGLAIALWLAINGGSREILIGLGISAVMAVGYQTFVGATGIVSFGHVAFAGVGAYTAGILTVPAVQKEFMLPDLPGWLAGVEVGLVESLIAGAVVAAAVALVTGLAIMRSSGTAAGIATLAILVITNEVLRNADKFTKGTQTFFGVPERSGVLAVYGTLVIVVVVAVAFKLSRLGVRARAVRDDPLAAETSGINVAQARLAPWVLSAAITGAGGALWAQQLTAFSPKTFYIAASVPVIVMVVLGGINSVTGAIVGAIVLTFVQEFMRRVEGGSLIGIPIPSISGIAQISLGVVLIAVLWKRNSGLLGSLELEVGRRRRVADPTPAPEA